MKIFQQAISIIMAIAALPCISTLASDSSSPDATGDWVQLFDGKSLNGWKASEATNSFYVQDGCIVADGKPRSPSVFHRRSQTV